MRVYLETLVRNEKAQPCGATSLLRNATREGTGKPLRLGIGQWLNT
jgi:hypothetical protein